MKIKAKCLRKGMVVISETGKTRTVTSDAVCCRARGYIRAETTGEPVNTHGDNLVEVKG